MILRIYLSFIILVSWPLSLNAQSVRIKTTVKNSKTGEPLPYATIYSVRLNAGIYSDDMGIVDCTLDASDTVTISFLSYLSKKLPVKSLSNTREILLEETSYQLNTVEVISTKKRRKTYQIGFYDDPTDFDAWGVIIGGMAVNHIINNTQRVGYLKTLLIDMGKAKNQVHRAKARVRIYSAANPKAGPGLDMLNENIMFDIPRYSKHQKVDLAPFHIKFPLEGLFIGVEFLGFETKEGFAKDWKQQTGGRITSTRRDDYRSVGTSWRFPDSANKPRWMKITDGSEHKAWERVLFKIGAEVESIE